MPGVYAQSAQPSSLVFAGFVAARGWAHETASTRGDTLAALEQLAVLGELEEHADVTVQVGVDALSATLLVNGPSEAVAWVLEQIRRRLDGTRPMPTRAGPQRLVVARTLDMDALWWRFGAQSFGLLGYAQYGHRDATDATVSATLAQVTRAGLVPFGVGSDAARVLEAWSGIAAPALPGSEPVPTLPVHLPVTGSITIAALDPTTHRLAATVLMASVAPLFAAPSPDRPALLAEARDLGGLGTHRVLHLPGRDPTGEELARLVATLSRLRADGPTETEIVVGLDRVTAADSARAADPVRDVMDRAQRQAVGGLAPAAAPIDVPRVHEQLIEVLDSLLVLAPADAGLTQVLAGKPGQIDQTKLGGRTYRPTWYVTDGPGPGRRYLQVGPEGVSVAYSKGRRTIHGQDVVAVERWADGDRRVLSRTGYSVYVDPLGWRRGDQAIALLDGQPWAVPVEVGRRSPEVADSNPDEQARERIRLLPVFLLLPLLLLAGALRAATNPVLSTWERIGYPLLMGGLAVVGIAAVLAGIRQHRRVAARAAGPS
ncbi:MAG: hypothetical protein WCF36_01490 [Candidatus Nanopelagicales bacterium]